ncbi:MAG: DUF159 family protein [Sphingomonadaceae bacterium]|nr:DUF159 family protein [Sphingomonadaceae bacterium]
MCNLYTMDAPTSDLFTVFGIAGTRINLQSYDEIYPNREAPIVRMEGGERILERVTWGMPGYGKVKRPITNVRNLESNFWKNMLADPDRRCLVPATKFCEWTGEKGSKRKVWFEVTDQPLFAFAGIWRPTEEGARMAFLTTEPNETVGAIHPKAMPVILRENGHKTWLDAEWNDARGLVAAYDDEAMEIAESD